MKIIKDIFDMIKKLDEPKPKQNQVVTPRVKSQTKEPDDLMEVILRVVGVRHDNPDGTNRQEILQYARVNQLVELKRTPTPDYPNAIQVLLKNECIGFISEYDNKILAKYMDQGGQIYNPHISYLYENLDEIISVCEITFKRHKMTRKKKQNPTDQA